ncbi:ferrochelatase, partial [Bacteroidota bacterium]
SSAVYRKLWLEEGSPLLVYGKSLTKKLNDNLGKDYVVELAMRYQNPSIKQGLSILQKEHISELIVLPLFPQYASATTGSIIEMVMKEIRLWQNFPAIRFIGPFYDHKGFINGLVDKGKKYLDAESWDHIMFSFHGLPQRQIIKASRGACNFDECCDSINEMNFSCYRAQCFETSRLLARALDIQPDKYSVVFQSRLGKSPWIQPYAEDIIRELPDKDIKRVLIFCPSFVSDCLETTVEVGVEFKELFIKAGGEKWQLVEGLNDSDVFMHTLQELIHIPG